MVELRRRTTDRELPVRQAAANYRQALIDVWAELPVERLPHVPDVVDLDLPRAVVRPMVVRPRRAPADQHALPQVQALPPPQNFNIGDYDLDENQNIQ